MKCRRFLRLSAEKRLRAVLVNRYCSSCLAHEHSDGSCRRGDGCNTCGQDHHTLLHLVEKPRARRKARQEEHRSRSAGVRTQSVTSGARPSSANSRRGSGAPRPGSATFRQSQPDPRPPTSRHSSMHPRPSSATPRLPTPAHPPASSAPRQSSASRRGPPLDAVAAPTLSSLLQRNSVNVLPTALVRIDTGTRSFDTGALIDPCTPSSCIDASLAACFRLPPPSEGDEQVCSATVGSTTDDSVRLEVMFKIEPHVRVRTPSRELSEAKGEEKKSERCSEYTAMFEWNAAKSWSSATAEFERKPAQADEGQSANGSRSDAIAAVAGTTQPVLGYVHPEVPAPSPISYGAPTTSIQGWTPCRLPDLPDFEGQPEEWPIFLGAFTETTAAYQCTELKNNQRLVKALKGEARETVKSLLIHPSNVQAVMEQLRFRYGRPEQLIRSQLESVREVQPIQEANIARIVPFATKVSNLSAFLQSTATGSQHLANPTLMEELIAKLPLSKRCCPICEGQHQGRDCKDFISASTTTRIESARKRLCFSCLEPGHMSRFCRKRRGCNVLGCQMRHHHLLHEVPERSKRPLVADGGHRRDQDRQPYRDGSNRRGVPRSVDSSERNHPTSAAVVDARRERDEGRSAYDRQELPHRNLNIDSIGCHLLFRILPVTLYGENTKVDTYALLDEGSSVTLIDDELIRSLNLKGESRQLNVQWFGGKSAKEHTKVVSLQISASGKPKRHVLKNVYGVANLNLPMQSLRQEDVQAVKANTRLPVMPYNNATPRIPIGLDHAHLGVPFRIKSYGSGGPFAADTALGWVVYGPVNGKPSSPLLSTCLLAVPQDDLLEKMVSDYFETENFGAKPVQPVAAGRVDLEPSVGDSGDSRALSTLEKTTKRVGQRYETGLLWKDDEVRLPESYSMALRRLVNIERKMKRDVDFASAYIRIMGYARRLEAQEVQRFQEGKVWYLPHFGVENPNKPGKIRLVFDAAAKVDGVSLNSALLKDPQRYKPLPAVLFHFREGEVGVCADIKEMFHQVLLQPKDRCAQRFLWRDGDDQREPDVYEMAVMTFGAACSPCSADYVKTVNALRYSSTDPRAALAFNEYHYVDDYVDSFDSEDEAIAISTRVREIHAEAGFDLCRFTSSSASVVRALNPLESIASVGWTEAEEKVLGMYWQPATDDFKFVVKFLSLVMSTVMKDERIPPRVEF
ncbi:uncharacterized protein, partial [Drosophila bipectinata]|uniref:uncharacterized protein n=1 Tax=Drosophila bipectinata TaxID=42026 RepID=UPI0038B2FA40